MTLESNRNLGGIGAILLIVGTLAFFVQPYLLIVGLVGIILMLVALRGLADYYKERGIFNNALYAFIALVVGVGVTFAGLVYLLFYTTFLTDLVSIVYPGFNGDWASLPNMTPNTNIDPTAILPFVGTVLSILAIVWIFGIIASFFAWRSLKGLSSRSSVGLFSTAGILLLIGAFLTIVVIGLILMWIAVLLMAVAFFQLKPQPEQPPVTAAPPTPTPV